MLENIIQYIIYLATVQINTAKKFAKTLVDESPSNDNQPQNPKTEIKENMQQKILEYQKGPYIEKSNITILKAFKVIFYLFFLTISYGCGVYSFTGASISPEVSAVNLSFALKGVYLTLFASPKTAAATALHTSTSTPVQFPDASAFEKPGNP